MTVPSFLAGCNRHRKAAEEHLETIGPDDMINAHLRTFPDSALGRSLSEGDLTQDQSAEIG
jgi:hypothetical protein